MNAVHYQSFADAWESRATIRTRPRRRLEDDDKLIFPMSRQPLVHSQTFLSHCPQLRDFVLVQSLYKFCLLYTSPSPRDRQKSRMPSSA